MLLAGAVGIEPTLAVLETAILPLKYAPLFKKYTKTPEKQKSRGKRLL